MGLQLKQRMLTSNLYYPGISTLYSFRDGIAAKRAETRLCPACNEQIPLRLLQAHATLELQRVDDIARHIGDAEPLPEADDLEEG